MKNIRRKRNLISTNTTRMNMFYLFSIFSFFFFPSFSLANSNFLEKGEKIFKNNCIVCHAGGNNLIIPEKNLKKETLEANGMNTKTAISYQVLNGKNGMPAFGGRLKENEIEAVAIYVLEQSEKNFKN
jgi:cytochrome c6